MTFFKYFPWSDFVNIGLLQSNAIALFDQERGREEELERKNEPASG